MRPVRVLVMTLSAQLPKNWLRYNKTRAYPWKNQWVGLWCLHDVNGGSPTAYAISIKPWKKLSKKTIRCTNLIVCGCGLTGEEALRNGLEKLLGLQVCTKQRHQPRKTKAFHQIGSLPGRHIDSHMPKSCSVQVPATTNPLVSMSGTSGAPMKSLANKYGLLSCTLT